MTTKHQPATPLPWDYDRCERPFEPIKAMDRVMGGSGATRARVATAARKDQWREYTAAHAAQNAIYIAHAANAYPLLVEALRGFVEKASTEKVEDFSDESNKADSALALLRELGEE